MHIYSKVIQSRFPPCSSSISGCVSLPSLLVRAPLLCSVLGWWRSPEAVEARRRPQARKIVVVERPLIIARARFVFERWSKLCASVPTPRASWTVDRRAGISDLFVREKRSTGIIIRFQAFEVGLLTLAAAAAATSCLQRDHRGIFSTFLRNMVVSSITDFLTQSVSEDEGPGQPHP